MVSQEQFELAVVSITEQLDGQSLNAGLRDFLNREFPPEGDVFQSLAELCRLGIREGWLCDREHGGIKFGRIIKPGPDTHGYSVDVVEMENIVGPYHGHPTGEIDMIIPETDGAEFDGNGQGWLVYGPDSAHAPTVSNGKAIVLYLLPDGAIDFTRAAPE